MSVSVILTVPHMTSCVTQARNQGHADSSLHLGWLWGGEGVYSSPLTWTLLNFHPSILQPIVHEICSPVFPHLDPINSWRLTRRWLYLNCSMIYRKNVNRMHPKSSHHRKNFFLFP